MPAGCCSRPGPRSRARYSLQDLEAIGYTPCGRTTSRASSGFALRAAAPGAGMKPALLGCGRSPRARPAPAVQAPVADPRAAGRAVDRRRGAVHVHLGGGTLAAATLIYIAVGGFRAWLVHDAWQRAGEYPPPPPALPDSELPRYTVLVPLYREAERAAAAGLPPLAHGLSEGPPRDPAALRGRRRRDDRRDPRRRPAGAVQARRVSRGLSAHEAARLQHRARAGDRRAVRDLRRRGPAGARPAAALRRGFPGCARGHRVPPGARSTTTTTTTTCSRGSSPSNTTSGSTCCCRGWSRTGIPVPLGGTSNHLRVAELRALGGWDPYNVTEDADLGMRLHAAGGRTGMLGSVTLEEACSRVRPWIRQRTRWQKGYIQTWLVHSRERQLSPPQRLARRDRDASAGGRLRAGEPAEPAHVGVHDLLRVHPGGLGTVPVPGVSPVSGRAVARPGEFLLPVCELPGRPAPEALAPRPRRAADAVLLAPDVGRRVARRGTTRHAAPHFWEKTPHGLSGRDTDPAFPGTRAGSEAAETPLLEPGRAVS